MRLFFGSDIIGNQKIFSITVTATNCTFTGDSSIVAGGTASLTFTADSGYDLPSSVSVSGATYSWNDSTGVLSLSAVTANVTVSVEAEAQGGYDPVLANNTLQQIYDACRAGQIPSTWALGDVWTDSSGIKWQLVDKKAGRYARADGNGSTNAVFMAVDSHTNVYFGIQSSNYSSSLCTLRTTMQSGGSCFALENSDLSTLVDQNKIVVRSNKRDGSGYDDVEVSFFAACYTEMGFTSSLGYASDAETLHGATTYGSFEYFADNQNSKRIKKLLNNQDYTSNYWTRSRLDSTQAVYVFTNGGYSYNATNLGGVYAVPCFAF